MAASFIKILLIYVLAAISEISGCFCFWIFFREGKSFFWLCLGSLSLICFAWVLTFSPSDEAGRAFAVYGGIYIVASLLWMWIIEGSQPNIQDMLGALFCLVGACIIFLSPRFS